SRRRHTRFSRDWSSDVCSSDLFFFVSSDFSVSLNGFENCFYINSVLTFIHSSIAGLRFKKVKWMKMLCYVFLMSSITALCLTRSPEQRLPNETTTAKD